jgi:protein-L-isoaspartate O-methyltransferase
MIGTDSGYQTAILAELATAHERWNEKSPFGTIVATAVTPAVRQLLMNQMRVGAS